MEKEKLFNYANFLLEQTSKASTIRNKKSFLYQNKKKLAEEIKSFINLEIKSYSKDEDKHIIISLNNNQKLEIIYGLKSSPKAISNNLFRSIWDGISIDDWKNAKEEIEKNIKSKNEKSDNEETENDEEEEKIIHEKVEMDNIFCKAFYICFQRIRKSKTEFLTVNTINPKDEEINSSKKKKVDESLIKYYKASEIKRDVLKNMLEYELICDECAKTNKSLMKVNKETKNKSCISSQVKKLSKEEAREKEMNEEDARELISIISSLGGQVDLVLKDDEKFTLKVKKESKLGSFNTSEFPNAIKYAYEKLLSGKYPNIEGDFDKKLFKKEPWTLYILPMEKSLTPVGNNIKKWLGKDWKERIVAPTLYFILEYIKNIKLERTKFSVSLVFGKKARCPKKPSKRKKVESEENLTFSEED